MFNTKELFVFFRDKLHLDLQGVRCFKRCLMKTIIVLFFYLYSLSGIALAAQVGSSSNKYGYVSGSGSAEYFIVPQGQGVINIFRNSAGKTDKSFWGKGFTLTGGLFLPDQFNFLGKNSRFEIAGNFSEADSHTSKISNTNIGFVPIDRSAGAFGTVSGPGVLKQAEFDTSIRRYGIDALFVTDAEIDILKSLSFFSGFTYSRTNFENEYGISEGGVKRFDLFLHDIVETDFYGFVIGTNGSVNLFENLDLNFGGRVEALYADSEMRARQQIAGPSYSRKDSDDELAGRFELNLGLAYQLKFVTIAVGGKASYLTYQPYAKHPLNDFSTDSPSYIDDDELWVISVGGSVTVPF